MEDKNETTENLGRSLDSMRDMWMSAAGEAEELKRELLLYKELCRVQWELIHR